MKFKLPLLLAAALLVASPAAALADPGGYGRWPDGGGDHGGGRFDRGDGGRFGRGGPDQRGGPEGPGRGRYGGQNWGGGPLYAGPGGGRGDPEQDRPPPDQGWRGHQGEARQGVREGRYIGLGRALSEVARRHPGRQLDAGLEQGPGGQPAYRIRWAGPDGRRMDVIVDARTGAILSEEGR